VVNVSQTEALAILERKLESLEKQHSLAMELATKRGEAPPISTLSVGINHHLENIDSIEKKLVELGVTSSSLFGTEEPPKTSKVAMASNIPLQIRRSMISLAHELGFEYYGLFDPTEVEFSEDVLFGAYGEDRIKISLDSQATPVQEAN
jgi:hypothetical protein